MGENGKTKSQLVSFLESVVIGTWMYTFTISGLVFLPICLYLLFYTSLWVIIVPYFVWIYYDRETPFKGGKTCEWFKTLRYWDYYRNYFPMKLVKTADLDPEKNYIFACHPHGIFVFNAIGNLGMNPEMYELFPNHTFFNATLNQNFYLPIVRELLIAKQAISFNKESITHVLTSKKKGHCVTIIVGGSPEALMARPRTYRLFLKKRWGFIKIALQTGSSVVPVIGFGEVDLYDFAPNPPGSKLYKFQQLMLKYTGVAWVLPRGRGFLNLLPNRVPLTTLVGEPLDLPKIENPTVEDVGKYHELYTEKLKQLFYDHREKYIENGKEVDLQVE